MKVISPVCSKCKSQNTYDIIPNLPNRFNHDIENEPEVSEVTYGNAKYYCRDCENTWKKYRGKKPYEKIRKIYAFTGGWPGPSFDVKIDFEAMMVNHTKYNEIGEKETAQTEITIEEREWFLSELYKCDFVNWAEEYLVFAMDGTQWNVRIEYETYCENKTGSNHFPIKWTKFKRAIAKISEGDFY
ncbi:hypothetical protein [Mesobacillus harenae]|uniref:hypothetical protein n=1 Tax=Mesobacillus harenae TaxID=2213203 RepID=UPI0015809B8A|nr:hypothetical protein [Mesobacillus harenae]